MELSISFYMIAICAIMLTGFSKSGFGGGLGLMAVPLMSLFVTPQFAAAVMMPLLLVMDILVVWRYRTTWNRGYIFRLLPAALVGLGLGMISFQHFEPHWVSFLIGVLATVFVVQFIVSQRREAPVKPTSYPVVLLLGVLSGFSSYVAHAGGPPVKGYLLKQRFEKSMFVGTNTVFFFLLNIFKTIAYGTGGMLTATSLKTSALLSPVLFLGVYLGLKLHKTVDQAHFFRVVYAFLTLAAVKLLYDGISVFLS